METLERQHITIEDEMRRSYLDYAMSVIVARALPDVRDGLKPVHRRILWAMHEAGLQPNRPRVKSANVVGNVMGNYHPHGDQAIYDTLVRMAQPFSLRYPLIDGQGNFGNIDDKPEANVEDLMKHVKGPDFPTGAIVVGRSGIRDAYRTGRGRIIVRGRAHIEELRGGRTAIIVSELPY